MMIDCIEYIRVNGLLAAVAQNQTLFYKKIVEKEEWSIHQGLSDEAIIRRNYNYFSLCVFIHGFYYYYSEGF